MSQPVKQGSFKEFPLTSFAISHSTTVLVMGAFLTISGIISYLTIPRESAPEIVVPNVIVNTVYPGVAPRDVENLVTRPLEEELNTIGDVETITSTSTEGYSSINIEFRAGMDMNEAIQRVREKVDIAKPKLPAAAEEPEIVEINFAEFPIMQVNIAGPYSLERLRQVAEGVQEELEQVPGVLEVRLSGGLEREVKVDVDLPKLKYYGLAFDDVIQAIREENVTIPGGSIEMGGLKYLVRVPGEFGDTDPISDIVITTRNGRPVYVRDVASVDFGYKERESLARLDGNPVVSLAVVKRAGENLIQVADRVRETIAVLESRFPPGTVVKITSDQSEDIRSMVSSLENNIISGLILVVGVLLFFLGARTAWFVGLAIPLSMFLSFSILKLAGVTLNMVVLFSLILALGMLVDNAIVVVENTYRFRERGFGRVEAAKFGTAEVAMPIIGATATTLAAFLPLWFWPGIVGEFMKYLPLTLIVTLSSSLFVALVIVPTACSLWLDTEDASWGLLSPGARWTVIGAAGVTLGVLIWIHWLAALLLSATGVIGYAFYRYVGRPVGHWLRQKGLPVVLVRYEGLLRWALNHRRRVLAGSLGVWVAVFFLFARFNAGIEFFPENIPPNTVYVQVKAPLGTPVEETDRLVRGIESEIRALPDSGDIEAVVATVGSMITSGFSGRSSGSHLATVAVNLVDYRDRRSDAFTIVGEMRRTVGRDLAGAEVSVEIPEMGPPTGRPVTVEISGEDPELLRALADSVVRRLEDSPVFAKLEGLENDLSAVRPELVVEVDRERAALYGLSTQAVGNTIRSAINGTDASKYRDGRDEYDIKVRLADSYRKDLEALADLTVVDEGDQIPLTSVARWYLGAGLADIKRKDLDRVATVSADVRAGYNANAVRAEVEQVLSSLPLPEGYRLRYAGQQVEQEESRAFLTASFVIAVMLIGFILVAQFDSVTTPLIILTSVIMSTVGVLVGLLVFRMPFGIIMTGVGLISLAGVVVNNAIVLLDYTNLLERRDGVPRGEAVVLAGRIRFRPVWLTAITTVLGLVPLGVGLNVDFMGFYARLEPDIFWGGEQATWWGPMAIAVIVGLLFATFLTLVLVPVLYWLLFDAEQAVKRWFRRQEDGEGAELSALGGLQAAGRKAAEPAVP